eukprot:TRINITY_DN5375_c0_g1_i1.p1 TRINITY_DN5375_c0_g1~~TRINITY_DN5375_c0_g1_i1.p1  ORF type:complete len:268 (+),score=21.28 TRINITY_DN5375_c0_g1_i1:98-901(+)
MFAATFTQPFFVLNFILLLFFCVARLLFVTPPSWLQMHDFGSMNREQQVFILLVGSLVLKYRKALNFEDFLSSSLWFAKITCGAILMSCDYRVGSWFLILALLISFLVRRRETIVPTRVFSIEYRKFPDVVLGDKSGCSWVVMFYALWSDECISFAPTFSTLSTRFASTRLKFARVDLTDDSDGFAEKYHIDIGAFSRGLPCLLCFKNGQLDTRFRLPPLQTITGAQRATLFSEAKIIRLFDLDNARQLHSASSFVSSVAAASKRAR